MVTLAGNNCIDLDHALFAADGVDPAMNQVKRFPQGVNLVVGIENLFDYTAGMITFNTSTSPGRSYFVKLDLSIEKLYRSIHKSK